MKLSRKHLRRLILQEIRQNNHLNEVFLTGPVLAAIIPATHAIAALLGYSYLTIQGNINDEIANNPEIVKKLRALGHKIETDMKQSPVDLARKAAETDPEIKALIEKIESGYVSKPVSNIMNYGREYNPVADFGSEYRGIKSLVPEEDD